MRGPRLQVKLTSNRSGDVMPVMERERTIRPSTRQDPSPYEIDTKAVGAADTLRLTILGEESGKRKLAVVEFRGSDLVRKNSFYFRVETARGRHRISFIGAQPVTIVVT
jgi:hypothetical protein